MPDFPESVRYLWDWYLELRMGIGEWMTWTDLDAWSRHTGNAPEPREAVGLFLLQVAWHEGRSAE